MNKKIYTIPGFILIMCFSKCKDEYTICDFNTSVNEKSGFYHINGGIEQVAYAPSFSLSALGVPLAIYSAVPNLSKFSLPLNPLLDSAKFQLSINNNVTIDTITFFYNSHSMLLSPECGSIYVHNLTRIKTTKHKLDSVSISNGVINNISGENVKIYF